MYDFNLCKKVLKKIIKEENKMKSNNRWYTEFNGEWVEITDENIRTIYGDDAPFIQIELEIADEEYEMDPDNFTNDDDEDGYDYDCCYDDYDEYYDDEVYDDEEFKFYI